LRGVGFCAACGSPLYPTKNYLGGRRGYACRDKLESRGLCDSLPIPADLLETHVLNHLQSFIGSVEGWIADLLTKRDAERNVRVGQLEQERAALATLDRQRDERMTELEQVGMTKIGLEVIERVDAKREAQANRIAEADAVVAEWTAPPNIDATLDFYSDLVDLVQGRVSKAIGARELNEALGGVLAGLWCEIEPERDRLLVQFELREQPAVKLPDGSAFLLADYNGRRDRRWLPPARLGYQPVEPPDLMGSAKTAPKPLPSTRCTA
jgi:hypothetical protein